jgi:hypothetical protein
MLLDFQNLVLRFEEIKEGYAQAKTPEEKRELLASLLEVVWLAFWRLSGKRRSR